MKTTSYFKKSIVCGASVIGKSHIINKTPNQDSYKIKRSRYGFAISVCDGVGSNKYSKHGSRAACKAVAKVFKLYHKKKVTKEQIGDQIELHYKKYVWRRFRNQAATTCLFAFVYSNSEVIIGQAGDGVILIKKDNNFIVFKSKEDDFMNEVSALSCKHHFKGWKIKNVKFDFATSEHLMLLLSTDGISEDIIPDKREDFFNYFIGLSESQRKSKLKQTLKEWSVPGSIDDKTVITFNWRKVDAIDN